MTLTGLQLLVDDLDIRDVLVDYKGSVFGLDDTMSISGELLDRARRLIEDNEGTEDVEELVEQVEAMSEMTGRRWLLGTLDHIDVTSGGLAYLAVAYDDNQDAVVAVSRHLRTRAVDTATAWADSYLLDDYQVESARASLYELKMFLVPLIRSLPRN